MVKAVFLDIDGTLMDTNYLHVEAWAQAFEEVGARPPHSRIHYEVGKGSESSLQSLSRKIRRPSGSASSTASTTPSCRNVGTPCPALRSS